MKLVTTVSTIFIFKKYLEIFSKIDYEKSCTRICIKFQNNIFIYYSRIFLKISFIFLENISNYD